MAFLDSYQVLAPNKLSQFLREDIFFSSVSPSGITTNTLDRRLTDPEQDSDIEVIGAKWYKKGEGNPRSISYIEIIFYAYKSNPDKVAVVITPRGKKVEDPITKGYHLIIRFLSPEKVITREAFKELDYESREQKFEEIIQKCPIQLHSNDPSWYYSSGWEKAAQQKGSVYPFPGPKGDDIWFLRHKTSGGMETADIPISKHMVQVLETFDAFLPKILTDLGPDDA